MPKYPFRLLALTLCLANASCTDSYDTTSDADRMPAESPDIQLIEIMQGLESDLADAAHGIWMQDREIVQSAATRIAEHPKVSEEQLAAIKLELGSEMGVFAQYDEIVHSAAVELAESAGSSENIEELFVVYHRIETGCLNCHSSFQKRISAVLAAP